MVLWLIECEDFHQVPQWSFFKVWKCEFCEENNLADVEPEEIPKNDDVTFMIQPAMSTTASGESGIDRSLIIFCVDTSGSMCVTTEVRYLYIGVEMCSVNLR